MHPKTKTPVYALLANMVVGLVALATGKTGDLILIAVFGALTLYILSSAAVLQLRRAEPDLVRPYRTPLYPVTPLIALVLSLVCFGAMIWKYPTIAVVYAVILVVALTLFRLFVPATRHQSF